MKAVPSKKCKVAVLIICSIAVGVVLLAATAGFGCSNLFTETGGCFSVAFDKTAMRTVDKAVVVFGGKEIEITDPALVSSVVDETVAATHTHVGCPEDRRIDLYSGDRLIRSMGWSTCCDTVHVYSADATHWIVSVEGFETEGFIYLSDSLAAKLNQCIGG